MTDVLVVGAGPAGAVAAAVLARAGVRVTMVDRAWFPRDKLCGDTVNPGAMSDLQRLGLAGSIAGKAVPIDGVLVTGEGGVSIAGRYPRGLRGSAIPRRHLDALLLEEATRAGARFDGGVTVRKAVTEGAGRVVVTGVGTDHGARSARVVIAADGRRSAVASSLSMSRSPEAPSRWAIGAYVEGAASLTTSTTSAASFVEMHIRRGWYAGVVAVPGDLVRVCMVASPDTFAPGSFQDPAALLHRVLRSDPQLRERFTDARLVGPPTVLGPLAVGDVVCSTEGLLLAGDAAGFIDPMTGDGLRFAIHGGELAALAAIQALEHGWAGVHEAHTAARRRAFGGKHRFNRALRTLVASPAAVGLAARGARFAPGLVRLLAARAGDCHLVARDESLHLEVA